MLLSNSLVPSKNTNGVLWEQQQVGLIHTVKASCAMTIQNVIYNFANELSNTNMHR